MPASTQLAEALKAQIIRAAAAARRALAQRTRIDHRSGLSCDRARGGRHAATSGMASAPARLGYLRRRSGDSYSGGVRKLMAEVLLSCGVTPAGRRAVTPDRTGAATDFRRRVWLRSCGSPAIRTGDQPRPWLRPIFRPAWAHASSQPLSGSVGHRNHMRWGAGDWVYARARLPTSPCRRGPPDAADTGGGSPVLVVDRTNDGKPLEVS